MVSRHRHQLLAGLAGALLADGAFNAVALYDLAQSTSWGRWSKKWAKDDLDRLGFPEELRFVFPFIKFASAVGLGIGVHWKWIGRLTSSALVLYFTVAVAFHVRARDPLSKYPAVLGMLAWSLAVRSLFAAST